MMTKGIENPRFNVACRRLSYFLCVSADTVLEGRSCNLILNRGAGPG